MRRLLFSIALFPISLWAATINGTVRTGGGAGGGTPVPNATVRLIAANVVVDSTTSSGTGTFTFTSVATGTKQVQASAAGYSTASVNVNVTNTSGTYTANVTLTGAGTLSGTVVDSATQQPIVNALVIARTGGGGGVADSVLTNASGGYSIPNIPVGTVTVAVSATGYIAQTRNNVTITAGVTTTANFNLLIRGIGGLTGTVLDSSTGLAIGGALVSIRSGTGGAALDSTNTNSGGSYNLSNITSGSGYTVVVSATGYATSTHTGISITANGTVTLNVNLSPVGTGTITGTVRTTAANGSAALSGITIELRRGSATSAVIATTTTNGQGQYTFTGMAAGAPNYFITVVATNPTRTVSGAAPSNIVVTANGTATVNITLTGTAAIMGYSSPIEGMRFSVSGGLLLIDLGSSSVERILEIYGVTGRFQNRIFVPAGLDRVTLSHEFSPANGFLFLLK